MIPGTEVLSRAGMPSIHTLLEKAQARWAGHILHMDDRQLPKVLLYGEPVDGKHAPIQGKSEDHPESLEIPTESWNNLD